MGEIERGQFYQMEEGSSHGYLVMVPGDTHTLVLDLYKHDYDLVGFMESYGYEPRFIGTLNEGPGYNFIPSFRPVPNKFLRESPIFLSGTFEKNTMKKIARSLGRILRGELLKKEITNENHTSCPVGNVQPQPGEVGYS